MRRPIGNQKKEMLLEKITFIVKKYSRVHGDCSFSRACKECGILYDDLKLPTKKLTGVLGVIIENVGRDWAYRRLPL